MVQNTLKLLLVAGIILPMGGIQNIALAENVDPSSIKNESTMTTPKKESPVKNKYDEQFCKAIEYLFRGDTENAKKHMLSAADRNYPPALWYAYRLSGDEKYLIATAKANGKRAFLPAAVAIVNKNFPNTSLEDYKMAYRWYLSVTEEQLTEEAFAAMCNIGQMHLHGQGGLTPDYEKAMAWYQKAADHFYPRALREIGVKYVNMSSKTSSLSEKKYLLGLGYSHLAMAAFRGDARASEMISKANNLDIPISDKTFVAAARRFVETKQFSDDIIKPLQTVHSENHLFTNILLGGYYLNTDKNVSIQYYRNAARQGSVFAKTFLANAIFYNIVPLDEQIMYCKELSDLGYRMWRHNYASLLEKKGDMQHAIQIYQKNADDGDAHSKYRMFNLIMVNKAKGFSIPKALIYLIEASQQHYGNAEVTMGGFMMRDLLKISPRDAMIMLMKGIIDGVSNAETYDFALGEIAEGYAYGRGVEKDAEFARQICLQRVKAGNAQGYLALGVFYEQGVFGKKDAESAKKYYKAGADMGDIYCQGALDRLNSKTNK